MKKSEPTNYYIPEDPSFRTHLGKVNDSKIKHEKESCDFTPVRPKNGVFRYLQKYSFIKKKFNALLSSKNQNFY